MSDYYDTLPFNPFVHGTSSETLSMMKNTGFQLMPIVAMLERFKIAPMVGELTQGGFDVLGDGSNQGTIYGAPAFGRLNHNHYALDRVIGYTRQVDNINLNICKAHFKETLQNTHKSSFTNLNLVMIYLVRLRQLGIKISDVVSLDEINLLKERLDAMVQFYFFILCIQKHIFIDAAEMERFREENNLDSNYAVGDYIAHFFCFEHFLEKLRTTKFDIEGIYNSPSQENISKLLEFIKIPKNHQEQVTRYPAGLDQFIAKRDYNFFSSYRHEFNSRVSYEKMASYMFENNSGFSLPHYLEKYYKSYQSAQGNHAKKWITVPDFEGFHATVLSHIDVLKDRIQLCKGLINAEDNEFIPYDLKDELITHPFPVVLVTEAKTIEEFRYEYRSRMPLRLGKEITLVATDTRNNQKRLRDYLQKNEVGPVEVLLFDDLKTLRSKSEANFFDSFVTDDLMKAFELVEQHNKAQFAQLYRALSELNEKRFRFKSTHHEMYVKLNDLFNELQDKILTSDKSRVDFKSIHDVIQNNKSENYSLYSSHRGVLRIIDTLLTVLASLVVLYPITYIYQNYTHSTYTFFATDTELKINNTLNIVEDITNHLEVSNIHHPDSEKIVGRP